MLHVASAADPTPLFEDPVVARGKNLLIRQSELDETFSAVRASQAAAGQRLGTLNRRAIEPELLDTLIATRLILQRATDSDRAKGEPIAKEFIAEQRKQATSEAAFRRQLLARGMTLERYTQEVNEQGVVKALLDREIGAKITISGADAKKYYDEHPKLFEAPEMVRVAHILISTLDAQTRELPNDDKLRKRNLAEKVQARAASGADFTKLVHEFSDDANSKVRNGEYTLMRNEQRYLVTPEFEGAAFSLATNQVSSVVATEYGYHIIKALEQIPAKKQDYAEVEATIKSVLLREAVQKELPVFVEKLKKEAEVEILLPAPKK